MTDTTRPTSPVGSIQHIDPNEVLVEANVRTTTGLDLGFIDSIRENGVLTPVLAHRRPDGRLVVRAGQRRTLGAREAGVVLLVYIVEGDESTAARIIAQMVEKDQRTAMGDADRAAAFQQLTLDGLTPAVIAKRAGSVPASHSSTSSTPLTPT